MEIIVSSAVAIYGKVENPIKRKIVSVTKESKQVEIKKLVQVVVLHLEV